MGCRDEYLCRQHKQICEAWAALFAFESCGSGSSPIMPALLPRCERHASCWCRRWVWLVEDFSQRNSPAMKWGIECPVAQEKDAALEVQNSQKWWPWILAGEIQHGDLKSVHRHMLSSDSQALCSDFSNRQSWYVILCLLLWPQSESWLYLPPASYIMGEWWWPSPWWLNSSQSHSNSAPN